MNSNRKLLILAGGFGTRLRSELPGCPKPLAPIGEVPFLSLLLELWRSAGITDFVFLLHHEAEQIVKYLERNEAELLSDCNWTTITEPKPLGTGGAVANAVRELCLHGDFIVANADTWLGKCVEEVASVRAPAIGVLEVENTQRYGAVQFNDHGSVIGFVEKGHTDGAGWINAGMYHLDADAFASWNGLPFSLEQDLFPQLVKAAHLRAVPLATEFIDIGIPEDYRRFSRWIEAGRTFPL